MITPIWLQDMKGLFSLYGMFLKHCPACYANYMNTMCQITCSPNQEQFAKVMMSDQNDDGQEMVTLVDFFVSRNYADAVYKSCQNVTKEGA